MMGTLKINFETLQKPNWSEQEQTNAKLVIDFMQNLMNNHNFSYVLKKFNNDKYVQHNRGISDGLANLVAYISKFTKQFPEYSYNVKHIYTDGDFVIFHSHVTVKKAHRGNAKKGFNIIDTWRIEDGQIAEHWDSIQPLDGFMRFYIWLNGGKILNDNGVF